VLPGAQFFYDRMKEEFQGLGLSLDVMNNANILTYLNHDGTLVSTAPAYDFILFLDKDLYISYNLERAGFRLFNSARSIEFCDDKMLTHMALSNQGIAMPLTISAPLNYSTTISIDFVHNLEKMLSFPFIAKDVYGSLGEAVYLIHNEGELLRFEEEHRSSPRLYQEFITSSFGFDFRLIVIGGHFFAGMKRINKNGDFRSNIACGGVGEVVEIPKSYIACAEKVARVLKLDYCGVDILKGQNGEPVVCEVNSNAFISGIEKTTGKNVALAYAQYIQKAIS
jgi:gamma-F420-2:alpha-L-glutamate ligase